MSRVIVIGDQHRPYEHPDYLRFIRDTKARFKCDIIINIGDEVDNCALSRYEADPDGKSAKDELEAAIQESKKWYKAFPNMKLVESNHGLRPFKKAYSAGLPKAYLKSYAEFMQAPKGWTWYPKIILDKVLYFHGEPFSGENGAKSAAKAHRISTVIGHIHSWASVSYMKSFRDEIFAMNVGCGIDETKPAFNYAKDNARRPSLGCGVVLDGREALFIPMGSK